MADKTQESPNASACEEMSFFKKMPHRFDQISIAENEEIPTTPFLDACQAIVPVFDLLGPTLFSPVKSDIEGNINKLSAKHKLDSSRYATLQQMLLQELQDPEACQVNNAVDALLWLKRALEFIQEFFKDFLSGNPSLSESARQAYSMTLKKYHGYIVQGVFSLVVRAVPSRTSFANMLVPLGEDKNAEQQEAQIREHSQENFKALEKILAILNSFYKVHNIDSDIVV